MKNSMLKAGRSSSGFTLVEVSMSVAIITVVTIGMFNVFTSFLRSYNATSLMYTASARANLGLERMVYGTGTNLGLREAESSGVSTTFSNTDWQLNFTNQWYKYKSASKCIVNQSAKTICTNVVSSTLTYSTNGCQIALSVAESGGGRVITSTVTTYVQFRN